MDSSVRVEGRHATTHASAARALRSLAVIALVSLAGACGGGGGGDDGGNTETGQIAATVVDQFDAPVNDVTIEATIGSTTRRATTGSDGTATVTQVPTGSVNVSATADGLVEPPAQTVTVNAGATTNVDFVIERVTNAAGGVTRAAADEPTDGSSFTFRIRVFVIDEDFQPVTNLTGADFSLADCSEDDGDPSQPHCVRGSTAGFDVDYTVANATPADFSFTDPDPDGPVPYAAAVLLDSSESIAETDPTDARIFANKVYLEDIGSNNRVMLAAFADDADAQIPDPPLTIYPCDAAPCPAPEFTNNGATLFPSLDSLATLEGGGTPLYDSLGQMLTVVDDTADALPSPPANLRRAVVLFSDGRDIYCDDVQPDPFQNCTDQRVTVVEQSEQLGVDIVTIGLGANVDSLAMAELALRGRGAYLFADDSTQLIPIYGVLGRVLSKTLPIYEMVWTVDSAVAGAFAPGRAVIGRLTVDTGSSTFTLPFVVQIE